MMTQKCEQHAACTSKVEQLAQGVEGLQKGQRWIVRLVYTGFGLFMAGALIVGILFQNMDQVRADTTKDIEALELQLKEDRRRNMVAMDTLTVAVTTLERQVAVLATNVQNLKETIEDLEETMKERK